jgi:hypothetical protein
MLVVINKPRTNNNRRLLQANGIDKLIFFVIFFSCFGNPSDLVIRSDLFSRSRLWFSSRLRLREIN